MNPFYSHIRPVEMKGLFEERNWFFDDYVKFVVVRNPWARLASLYSHIKRVDRSFTTDFSHWLATIEPGGVGGGGAEHHRWRRYGAYSIENYIGDETGRPLVEHVLRLEDIDLALPRFMDQIGIPRAFDQQIPQINVGKLGDYRKWYKDLDIQIVEKKYHYDIERFNYTFEQGSA